jgi:hypothetical protein
MSVPLHTKQVALHWIYSITYDEESEKTSLVFDRHQLGSSDDGGELFTQLGRSQNICVSPQEFSSSSFKIALHFSWVDANDTHIGSLEVDSHPVA